MRNRKLLIGVLLALASASLHAATGALSAEFLRCEYRVDPAGMDVRQPRLSWVLISEQRGQKQTGYRVLVASTPQLLAQNSADLWESGQVGSDQTVHVVYEGKPLGSRARAFWKVQVWDREGAASVWSRPASWTMGLLEQSDWKAQWIADAYSVAESGRVPEASRKPPNKDAPPPKALPATLVRKTFDLDAPIERATAYVTGLGLYELRLNGHRVGDQILAPEWTNYRKRIQYQTFEVTNLLQPGVNTVGAMLGEGWYAGRLMVVGSQAYGSYPRFLLQLEIELANGQTRRIVTDASWHSSNDGPIRHSGIYDGEEYDARKEMPGWDKAGFAESGWRPVQSFDLGAEQLVWQPNEPIRVVKELKPAQVTEPKPGVYVFDLGQNMVGWCR
ncbi:MAG: alpha-L-rhamnosidase N-terminal domain-containing protein, partial [Verrucomicrobia bacterium]|nr:alpha-L-rhamnosidase N-terminal domain-containing protein [Verrucomicrobiota bacterium]